MEAYSLVAVLPGNFDLPLAAGPDANLVRLAHCRVPRDGTIEAIELRNFYGDTIETVWASSWH